jgi:hypothetical protein
MENINDIKPYFRNPRKNDKTVEALVKVIPVVGFNVPLVLDENNVIVKGHSRYYAGFKLGMTELPVVYHQGNEEAQKLDRISDNRVSEFSEWLTEGLEHELDMIDLGIDLSFLEFDLPKIDIPDDKFVFETTPESKVDENDPKYQEYLRKQQEKYDEVEKKVIKKQDGDGKVEMYKVVCPHCGEVTYIRKGDTILLNEVEVKKEE